MDSQEGDGEELSPSSCLNCCLGRKMYRNEDEHVGIYCWDETHHQTFSRDRSQWRCDDPDQKGRDLCPSGRKWCRKIHLDEYAVRNVRTGWRRDLYPGWKGEAGIPQSCHQIKHRYGTPAFQTGIQLHHCWEYRNGYGAGEEGAGMYSGSGYEEGQSGYPEPFGKIRTGSEPHRCDQRH